MPDLDPTKNPVFGTNSPAQSITLRDLAAALIFPQVLAGFTGNTMNEQQKAERAAARAYSLASELIKHR